MFIAHSCTEVNTKVVKKNDEELIFIRKGKYTDSNTPYNSGNPCMFNFLFSPAYKTQLCCNLFNHAELTD